MTFVGIGVGNRPHGGIATYLQGVTIPIVDFSFNGPAPTDPTHGFTTVDIAREYDGLADFPQYPINLLADLNALLGVIFVHARYDQVSLDPNSPKYVPGTISQKYGDTTYYQIPTPNLPLFDLARIVGVPEKLIDVVEPFVKVLVDTGYDRTIPFGEPTTLGLIPRVDPGKLATDLLAAAGTGAANALRLFAPATPTPISRTAGTAEATRSVAPSPVAASPEPSREKATSAVESTPSVDATKSVDVESNPSDVAADSLGAESTSDANTTESQDAAPRRPATPPRPRFASRKSRRIPSGFVRRTTPPCVPTRMRRRVAATLRRPHQSRRGTPRRRRRAIPTLQGRRPRRRRTRRIRRSRTMRRPELSGRTTRRRLRWTWCRCNRRCPPRPSSRP